MEFLIQSQNIKVFKGIKIPDNTRYKRIDKYISTYFWAQDDYYARCKQTITALRDLASIVDLPLKEKEKTAVKWAIYQLSGMLAFALSQICKQIQYFSDRDKEEMIRLGLLYGKNSKAKIEDILKITNNIARKTLSTFCVEEKLIDSLPEIRLSYPDYTEAFISIIFRMIDQPTIIL